MTTEAISADDAQGVVEAGETLAVAAPRRAPVAGALRRAVRAELIKLTRHSPVLYVYIPLAIAIPVILNLGIAIAQQQDLLMGQGGMETGNAGFWIITFTTMILMLAGVSSTCGEYGHQTIGRYLGIQPRRWVLPVAKLATFGGIGFLVSLITTLGILLIFPLAFSQVWGGVQAFSADGWRLIVGIPLVTFFTCALGIGLSLLIRRAGTVVLAVVLWKWGAEVFATYIPGSTGMWLQRLSPFRNAEMGAGQVATLDSAFGGPTGSLIYFAVLCLGFFGWGVWRLVRRDVDTD